MAISRIITSLAVLFLALLVVTVCSYPSVNKKESLEDFRDLVQVLRTNAKSNRAPTRSLSTYFGGPVHDTLHNVRRLTPEELEMTKALEQSIQDVGKRDYGDLGFFFGKRANSDGAPMQRQTRDYGDLGMFFGKRSGNDVTDDRDFADFTA